MELVLEDFVPYDESAAWQIHDAYYAERGIAAWTGGDIPFAASSNSGIARQHARLFVDLVRELGETGALAADDPVHVLEVGSGAGTFALNFVDALAHGCGPAGRAIAGRLRYVLSDYSPRNLEEATAHPGLARLVAAGTVVPALFDLRKPEALAIPGARSRKTRLAAVLANYICCVSPQKVIRRAGGALLEKHVRLSVAVADKAEGKSVARALTRIGRAALPPPELLERIKATYEWRPLDLERAFASPIHRGVVLDFVASLGEATINYPWSFLDLVRGLRPRVLPGGLFLVADFGNPGRSDAQGPTNDRVPVRYGLSLTHDVDFGVFDVFAAREGLGIVRTGNGLLDLQTVALVNSPEVTASFGASFERTHVRCENGQALLDLSAAAQALADASRFHEAARLYERCVRIAPRSPQVIHRFGQAFLATDVRTPETLERLARRLRLGRRLDLTGKHDFDTLLASVYLRQGEAERARRLLVRSLARKESAAKHATLALAHESLGDRERAYRSLIRALELEPEGEAADTTREKLVRQYLQGEAPPVRWSRRRGAASRPSSGTSSSSKRRRART
jgi:tetratricopeptide (TPR) repeat protein